MAINVNTVYTTVLSILNKEQRGYITPEEFNKLATQVQLEIFENYFEDLNQQLRVPQADSEYANRQKNIDNCISIFKTIGNTTYVQTGSATALAITAAGTGYTDSLTGVATTYAGSGTGLTVSILVNAGVVTNVQIENPGSGYTNGDIVTISAGNNDATLTLTVSNSPAYFLPPSDLHRIGTVIYKDEKELQRVERNDFLTINLSPLTKPTTQFPVYLYEQVVQGTSGANTGETHIFVKPTTIVTAADITVSYIRKPADVVWGYQQLGGGPWSSGPYIYNAGASTQFELDDTEQTEVILRILAYAGVVIRDPQIVQAASQAVQSEEVNSKS
jgi:hypothetical protein|tara:strand:+ start:31 stop:1023 length:993 start_codon:yes stop_codon:yes gene_type:complete